MQIFELSDRPPSRNRILPPKNRACRGMEEPQAALPPGVTGVRRGQLTLNLEWDPESWSDSLWSQRVRVKWWGEPGDGRLIRCAKPRAPSATAPPHDASSLPRRPAHGDVTMEDGEEDMSTLHYDVACGPQQLAKYLADMRMLVLNLEEADGEDEGGECWLGCVRGASSPSAATRIGCLQCTQFPHHMLASWSFLGAVRTLGYAYIHLSLAPFGAPFITRATVYAGDDAEDELAHLNARLFVTFADAGMPDAELAKCGPVAELVQSGRQWMQAGPMSLASSFVLNEKLAMLDPSLPMFATRDALGASVPSAAEAGWRLPDSCAAAAGAKHGLDRSWPPQHWPQPSQA